MTKSRITKFFLMSIFAGISGGILVAIGWFAFPDDVFVRNGSEIVGVQETAFAWTMLGVAVVGGLILAGAAVTGFAAWIGALLNTANLERKSWFIVIALLGILNCGLLGVFAYVVAGPNRVRQTTGASPFATASAV